MINIILIYRTPHNCYRCGDNTIVKSTLLPFSKVNKQELCDGAVRARIGILGLQYWLSFLVWPFIFCLALFFVFRTTISTDNVEQNGTKFAVDITEQRRYYLFIFVIAFFYICCRILIALKLSYTYPYFDKLSAHIVPTCCLIVLLFVQLSFIINFQFIRYRKYKKFIPLICISLFLIGGWGLIYASDANINSNVLASYYPYEYKKPKDILWHPFIWEWSDMTAMNDLHRNIPFTLFIINFLTFVFLSIRCYCTKFEDWIEKSNKSWGKWLSSNKLFSWILIAVIAPLCANLFCGNFGTSIITAILIPAISVYFCQTEYYNTKIWWKCLIPVIFIILALILCGDFGYYISLFGIVLYIFIIWLAADRRGNASGVDAIVDKPYRHDSIAITITALVIFGAIFFLLPKTDSITSQKYVKRLSFFLQYEQYASTGYRYADSDSEFMLVLNHSMQNKVTKDPLSPNLHQLHPSVSTGQSPVVLNDASAPLAFFGSFGWIKVLVILIGLMLMLIIAIKTHLPKEEDNYIPIRSLMRLLAMYMWVGATLLLILSYWLLVPFTGRLIPGLGVDSVGEALEGAALIAFMLSTQLYETKKDSL